MTRLRRPFSRRVLFSQLVVIIITLALVTAAFSWVGMQTVTEVTEEKALASARTLAIDPDVRAAATTASATHEDPPDEKLVAAMLRITDDLRDRSGIGFAVITDDRGIRLTHPDRSNIGKRVSTSPDEALAGKENVTHERGTLGETVRAKVPIYSTEDGKTVVGQVSVGIYASVLDADLRRELLILCSVAVLALAVGVIASLMLGRRLRRETLGIGPEELAEMARDQGAVLRGLDDGVLGFGSDGTLTLSNSNAEVLLTDTSGSATRESTVQSAQSPSSGASASSTSPTAASAIASSITSSDGLEARTPRLPADRVPEEITRMMAEAPEQGALRRRISLGDRILLATAVRVQRGGVSVGGVVTLRDETQMLTMARQLESVTAMAHALRTQRHEFANRLHTVLGLVDTGANEEAHQYLASILGTGPIATPVENIELISDPYLRAVLEAKGTTAAEAGVRLAVTADSLAMGLVRDPEAVTLILGNLIDNAVRAAVAQRGGSARGVDCERGGGGATRESTGFDLEREAESCRVEVELLSSGTELHAVVTDTGQGVDEKLAETIFDEGFSTSDAAGVPDHGAGVESADAAVSGQGPGDGHGLGIGLPLSRRVAARQGGRVWLIVGHDPELGGASFGMRLPEALDDQGAEPQHVSDQTSHADTSEEER